MIIDTEVNEKGRRTRRNCKQCLEEGKPDAKAVNMCHKCQVPLHPKCFFPYHLPKAPRLT